MRHIVTAYLLACALFFTLTAICCLLMGRQSKIDRGGFAICVAGAVGGWGAFLVFILLP